MNGTSYALNLAPVAGAARPCARVGHRVAWVSQAMSIAARFDWSQGHDLQTTKRSPRRLVPPLT